MRDFYSELKKLTIYGSILGGQNQKNGHSSLPEAPNAKTNTDSESTSKNTSKKIGLKKFFITPTQNIGDFRFFDQVKLVLTGLGHENDRFNWFNDFESLRAWLVPIGPRFFDFGPSLA